MPINCAIYNVVSLEGRGDVFVAFRGGGGGGGVCRPVLLIVTLFHTEKLSFSTLVFRPGAGRNDIIITYNGLKCKEKDFLKFISKRILLFLSCSFGIEATNPFMQSRIPSKTIPKIRPR